MAINFFVSTDQSKLDIDMIHNFLANSSYWAKGRSKEKIEKSIKNSLCFGVYTFDGKQIGLARVVTDYAVFAWILDVFILEEYRANGLGKLLMEEIMNHADLQGLQRWGLGTRDAHDLYKKYGFKPLINPEVHMEIVNKPS